MIAFNKVNFSFENTVILKDFTEKFEENRINCILGPSGCGKTTMLNLLAGILKEDSGSVTKPERVSYVFQDDALVPHLTAWKNMEFVLKGVYKEKEKLRDVINKYLMISGLENASNLYPSEMSGGMRQRLALIRAFAYPSDMLLMDEPFKALDITLRHSIIKWFLELYEENKRTVLFVTHNIDEALLAGDFIYVYSNKPMRLQNKFSVDISQNSRKLYDKDITDIKNKIYLETEKW